MLIPNEGPPSWSRICLLMEDMQEIRVQSLSWEDDLENKMATHSSILAWEILWTEEPGGLQSMGSQKRQTQLRNCTCKNSNKTLFTKTGDGPDLTHIIRDEVKWKSLICVPFFVTSGTIQSMELSRSEYWNGQPFPSPGDLPKPGIEPRSPTLQADSLPAEPQGKHYHRYIASIFRHYFERWLCVCLRNIYVWSSTKWKTIYWMGENICKSYILQGVNIQNI